MGALMPHPRRSPGSGFELTGCPQCAAPASVVPAADLSGVEHVRVWCTAGHWFLMPRELLAPAVNLTSHQV